MHRNWSDEILDGVGIQLKATVFEEAGETSPEPERVGDVGSQLRLCRDLRQLSFEPGLELLDDGGCMCPARRQADLRRLTPHAGFDTVEERDLPQHFFRDGRAITFKTLHEAPADMGPAVDELPAPFRAINLGQLVVDPVAITLQVATAIVLQEGASMHLAASRCIVEDGNRWIGSSVAPVIRDDRPEVPGSGGAIAGLENRSPRFIDEDASGVPQMLAHVLDHRLQVEGGTAHPVAERAAVKLDALALVDVGLTVERKMITKFADDHLGDQGLRRQASGNHVFGRMRLGHGTGAVPAGIARAAGHQHPELGRNDVETLGDILSDLRHLAAATGAERALWLDHPLDPRQMRRQVATVSLARRLLRTRRLALQRGFRLLPGSGQHTLGDGQLLERQVELVRRELLGAGGKLLALHLAHDLLEPFLCLFGFGKSGFGLGQLRLQPGILSDERDVVHGQNHTCSRALREPEPAARVILPQLAGALRALHGSGPHHAPIKPLEEGCELRGRHAQHAVPNLRPDESRRLQTFVHQHQSGPVPDQNLDPVCPLRPEHKGRAAEWIKSKDLLGDRYKAVMAFSKVYWLESYEDLEKALRHHHSAEAFRTARITRERSSASTPAGTRMMVPAISISIAAGLGSLASATTAGVTITSAKAAIAVTPPASASRPSLSRRRQSYTCERVAPYRLATSETDTPGRKLSAAIRARSASLRCLRPVGPSRTSRREARPVDETSNWASILPSNAMIRNPIQNWIRFSHAEHGPARMGSALRLH